MNWKHIASPFIPKKSSILSLFVRVPEQKLMNKKFRIFRPLSFNSTFLFHPSIIFLFFYFDEFPPHGSSLDADEKSLPSSAETDASWVILIFLLREGEAHGNTGTDTDISIHLFLTTNDGDELQKTEAAAKTEQHRLLRNVNWLFVSSPRKIKIKLSPCVSVSISERFNVFLKLLLFSVLTFARFRAICHPRQEWHKKQQHSMWKIVSFAFTAAALSLASDLSAAPPELPRNFDFQRFSSAADGFCFARLSSWSFIEC